MKRAFSGAKQPMNNEKRGKIRPPNLYLYLILISIEMAANRHAGSHF
jgi:hypothetical protein